MVGADQSILICTPFLFQGESSTCPAYHIDMEGEYAAKARSGSWLPAVVRAGRGFRMFGKKKKSRDESEKSLFRDAGKAFVCTMNGRGEMQIENYGSLGDYDEGKIILHCHKCTMTIEGEK